MVLAGDKSNMYQVGGVEVSGDHKVFDDVVGRFVEAKNHTGAQKMAEAHYTSENFTLYNLITENHRIAIKGLTFADYEEFDVTEEAEANVLRKLNADHGPAITKQQPKKCEL